MLDINLGKLRSNLSQLVAGDEASPCPFAKAMAKIDPETAELVTGMVEDPKGVSIQRMHAELQKANLRFAKSTLSHHRHRLCTCFPEGPQ